MITLVIIDIIQKYINCYVFVFNLDCSKCMPLEMVLECLSVMMFFVTLVCFFADMMIMKIIFVNMQIFF